MKFIFVLGGPGSGKGTQCAKIVKDFGFFHISPGELLRKHLKIDSPELNLIKNGQMVPSHITINLIIESINNSNYDKILIDGYPRNIENLNKWIEVMKVPIHPVIYLDVDTEVMKNRLLQRNDRRDDDNLDSIIKRLKVFEDLKQVLDILNVIKIDGSKSVEEVYRNILNVI